MKKKKFHFIHNPHDKFLFHALKNKKIAEDAIRAYAPFSLLEKADFGKMQLYKTKLVTPQYKAFEADIIYQIPLKEELGLFFMHIEHQSTVDKLLAIRVWQYILAILSEYAENHPNKPLPIIYPIIIYTGEVPYNASTDLFDLFGSQKSSAKKYLLSKIQLIDVCRLADEDIQKHRLFGLTEYAFKYKKSRDIANFFKTYFPWLQEVVGEIGTQYGIIHLNYVFSEFEHHDPAVLIQEAQCLPKPLGESSMTIAEYIKQQGIQQGMQQGIEQGVQKGIQQGIHQGKQEERSNLAKRLFARGFSIEEISILTQLSETELNFLLEQK